MSSVAPVIWRRHYKTQATFAAVRRVMMDMGDSIDAPHTLKILAAIFYHFDDGQCDCNKCELERTNIRDDLSRGYRQLPKC